MSSPRITYVPAPEPIEGVGGDFLYGVYRVRLEDGFTVLIPHDGHLGTVGAQMLDLADVDDVDMLIAAAERHRANFP